MNSFLLHRYVFSWAVFYAWQVCRLMNSHLTILAFVVCSGVIPTSLCTLYILSFTVSDFILKALILSWFLWYMCIITLGVRKKTYNFIYFFEKLKRSLALLFNQSTDTGTQTSATCPTPHSQTPVKQREENRFRDTGRPTMIPFPWSRTYIQNWS